MGNTMEWTDPNSCRCGSGLNKKEQPKPKVKYILNTDFGPFSKGHTMIKTPQGNYEPVNIGNPFHNERVKSLIVTDIYVTKVTEFKFGDRVTTFKEGDNVLTFISSNSNNESWIIHDGAETPFRVPTVNLIPAL